jgi:hypothetical protein
MKKLLISTLFIFIAENTFATPKYVVIQQHWLWGWKLKHVEKPTKKLNKWCYDAQTDTYYSMKSSWGFRIKLRNEKK